MGLWLFYYTLFRGELVRMQTATLRKWVQVERLERLKMNNNTYFMMNLKG